MWYKSGVKICLPVKKMREMGVQFLGWEDPLEEEMATHSSTLSGKFHGQRSLAGYSPWCCKELDRTEQLSTHAHISNTAGAIELIQLNSFYFVVVQSLSHVCLFAAPWTVARQASLPFAINQRLLRLLSVESVRPSNHVILCRPLLLLPSIFANIRIFSNESILRIR